MKIKFKIIILLIAFSMPSVFALFHPGFFQSDDGEWMIIRFSSFYQALADGQFPVRFLGTLNHGYGYPVANFLYPGFMYLGTPIHFLGFGFVDTIKIIFGASMVGSAIFCYLWLSRFFDRFSSFVGALFYLYTPYHLFDLYKRGSTGEILALAILPFILWQIERKSFFWASIGIALLIVSHNTLAILFLGLIVLYIGLDLYVSKDLDLSPVIPAKAGIQQSTRFPIRSGMTKMGNMSKDMKELFKNYFLIMILSLGLSAFFWIPAIFELQYTIFSETQVSEWQNYFVGLDLIGISTVAIFAIAFLLFVKPLYSSRERSESRSFNKNSSRQARTINFEVGSKLTIFFFVVGILSIFFASALSSLLWSVLPVSFIQFPFRFLSLTLVCVTFLSAVVVYVLPQKTKYTLGIFLLIILGMSAMPFIKPSEFFDKGEGFYATNMDTTTVKNEYMPKWVKERPVERYVEKVEIVDGVGSVNNLVYNSKKITFNVLAKEDSTIAKINTIYYPGWNAILCHPELDSGSLWDSSQAKPDQNDNGCVGKEVNIDFQNEKGVMELVLPKGENKVELRFSETPLRLFANILSLLSFVILVFWTKTYKMKTEKL